MTEAELQAKLGLLRDAIATGVEATWRDIQRRYPGHAFYAFVLSTVDDAVFVAASANSLQNHQKNCEEKGLEVGTPEEEHYCWAACDWGDLEYVGADVFDPASSLMAEIIRWEEEDMEAVDWTRRRDGVFQAMIDGLGRAASSGVFGSEQERATMTLFVTIYDSFSAEEIEDESARILNSPEVYEQFRNRFAATRQRERDEADAQEARYAALAELSPADQAACCINEFEQHLAQPLADHLENFKREQQILDLMVRVKGSVVVPLIQAMAEGINTPLGEKGYVLMGVIRTIAPDFDEELHAKMAALLIQYCEHNAGKPRWQNSVVHIAKFLYEHAEDEYPYPAMEGNNALRDYERFMEVARRHIA